MNATRNPNQSCPLARQGWKVVAVNFLDVALDWGRGFADRLGLNIDWQLADLTDYRPES